MELDEIISEVKKHITEKRYVHTEGVAFTAAALAMKFSYESGYRENDNMEFVDKARTAGYLHDNAKCLSDEELLAVCAQNNIPVTECEKKSPYLLHGKVGAFYAKTLYGIDDEDILNAITYHTTGRPGMSMLEKIIFTADYIEPGRTKQANLDYIRYLAFTDIDRCVLKILSDTLDYLEEKHKSIDDMTVKTLEYYKNKQEMVQMDKILNTIYNAIDDKKGGNTRILDISAITTISDYFIVTSGNNYNQVRAIADNVEEELLKKHGMRPERVEGYNNGEWILLDYIDYVIHVFDREQRLFYDIERIWSDGKEIEVK